MENLPEILASIARMLLWNVIPWALGVFAVAAALSATPFGKALLAAVQARGKDSDLLHAIAQDVSELRQLTLEISERLDATEHRLRQAQLPPFYPPQPSTPSDDRPTTPH